MTQDELKRAKELEKEIRELDNFIFTAERVNTGTIIKKFFKCIFRANGDWFVKTKEFNMNSKIKDRVLNELREYLKELREELTKL
ncbi:MAG: hypothetical protein Q8936_21255 [Bacillota bacterium]|nr:hypothetical protein [Bacillota bacterium]